jgi:hypothetical protein
MNTFYAAGFGLLGSFPAFGKNMVYRSDELLPNISINGSQPQKLRIDWFSKVRAAKGRF